MTWCDVTPLHFTNIQISYSMEWWQMYCINLLWTRRIHYSDVTMGTMASQITSLAIVYWTVYSGVDKKHRNSASLAFVRGIHWWPMNSPHKWPVTRKMFPFDDVIMYCIKTRKTCTIWRLHSCYQCILRLLYYISLIKRCNLCQANLRLRRMHQWENVKALLANNKESVCMSWRHHVQHRYMSTTHTHKQLGFNWWNCSPRRYLYFH